MVESSEPLVANQNIFHISNGMKVEANNDALQCLKHDRDDSLKEGANGCIVL